jgi:hypothetical protein
MGGGGGGAKHMFLFLPWDKKLPRIHAMSGSWGPGESK